MGDSWGRGRALGFGLRLVAEEEGEEHGHHRSIGGEDIPAHTPASKDRRRVRLGVDKVIDHRLCSQRTERSADAVRHDHEEPLGTGANGGVGLLVHEERTRDIEEVEGYPVDDHTQQEEPDTTAWVTEAEEGKAKHPSRHSDEHHPTDTEATQGKWDEQDTERLGELGEGDEDVGMLDPEGIGIGRYLAEGADEGISKAIGDLQADAEEHREDEEERHLTLLEEHEGT